MRIRCLYLRQLANTSACKWPTSVNIPFHEFSSSTFARPNKNKPKPTHRTHRNKPPTAEDTHPANHLRFHQSPPNSLSLTPNRLFFFLRRRPCLRTGNKLRSLLGLPLSPRLSASAIPETSSENLPPWVLDGLTVDFLNLPGGRTTLVDPLLRGIFSWIER